MTGQYTPFDTMPIGMRWRAGSAGKSRANTDPWSGATLTAITAADADDLDEAYDAAAQAQPEWAAKPPMERANVMRAAADIMTRRKDEITGWLIRETGGTAAKAELEWSLARSAADHPHRPEQNQSEPSPHPLSMRS